MAFDLGANFPVGVATHRLGRVGTPTRVRRVACRSAHGGVALFVFEYYIAEKLRIDLDVLNSAEKMAVHS